MRSLVLGKIRFNPDERRESEPTGAPMWQQPCCEVGWSGRLKPIAYFLVFVRTMLRMAPEATTGGKVGKAGQYKQASTSLVSRVSGMLDQLDVSETQYASK